MLLMFIGNVTFQLEALLEEISGIKVLLNLKRNSGTNFFSTVYNLYYPEDVFFVNFLIPYLSQFFLLLLLRI